jgi:hypothetical protein
MTNNITFDSDQAMAMLGVPGRLTHRTRKPGERAGCWTHQRWVSEQRPVQGWGLGAYMTVEAQYDDDCGNGHNTFTITATIRKPKARDIEAGGCLHDEIAQYFPELQPLIKWHLTSADGPMHYIANTLYLAGDADHNGLRAGEVRQIRNGKTGLPAWKLTIVDADGKETEGPAKYVDSSEPPADPGLRYTYVPWNRVGEGKTRELAHARSAAVWPEATDEQLSAPHEELRAALEARLPGLIAEFRAAIESAGFVWEPPIEGRE